MLGFSISVIWRLVLVSFGEEEGSSEEELRILIDFSFHLCSDPVGPSEEDIAQYVK